MRIVVILAFALSCAATACATNQIEDRLILDSKIYRILWPESPFILEPYIKKHNLKLQGDISTANHNGYHAIWMVRNKKLYLIGFDSRMPGKTAPGVKDLPGSKDNELFADWFTGTLTLDYGSFSSWGMGEISKRQKIKFKKGMMIGSQQPDGAVTQEPAPSAAP